MIYEFLNNTSQIAIAFWETEPSRSSCWIFNFVQPEIDMERLELLNMKPSGLCCIFVMSEKQTLPVLSVLRKTHSFMNGIKPSLT